MNAPRHRLKLDDEFPFDGTRCVTECGGKCCTDIDVKINPFDIYRIVTSPEGRKLGFTDTTKLSRAIDRYLGSVSGLPMACIKFTDLSGGLRTCPFLIPVKPPRTKRELRQHMADKRGRFRTTDGHQVMLCRLHKIKPLICRGSPLGRSQIIGKDGIDETHYFFRPPMVDCACVQTEKRVKVADYIKMWSLDEYYRESAKFHALLPKMGMPSDPTPLSLRKFLLVLLYDFDWGPVGVGIDPIAVRPTYNELIAMAHRVLDNWGDATVVDPIAQRMHIKIDTVQR